MSTLFTKIIRREIPSVILHEDDKCIVILDLFPINKGHALVISKHEYETILECPRQELSYLMDVAKKAAAKMTSELSVDGFNIMINNKPASGQEVPHLHIHIIPRYSGDGKTPVMTKEEYIDGEMERLAEILSF
jgi:histidine triad (HIT) family protein